MPRESERGDSLGMGGPADLGSPLEIRKVGSLREYETVFVLHPSLEENQVEEEIEGVQKTIEAGAGEIVAVERWGRRKLAYEIRKVHEGIYTLVRFRSDKGVFQDLERRYRLRESVLRHLTVVAQGPPPEPEPEKTEQPETQDSSSTPQEQKDHPEPEEPKAVAEQAAIDDKASGKTPESASASTESEGSAETPETTEADSQQS